ncbi:MAG: four helix bundle protein [Patescibacteria group bacterium]|nr:four helix bundle protein [Patescibacteria group bacterium]
MIKSFLDLDVYKDSFQLSLEIDEILKTFPKEEQFLLVDQSKRASRAIPALIAEGYAKRETILVFKKLTRDAIGEANEMINHLALAKAKGYIKPEKADELIERYHKLGKQLTRLKDNWKNF